MAVEGTRLEDKNAAMAQALAAKAQASEESKRLGDTRLLAPITGNISLRRIDPGQTFLPVRAFPHQLTRRRYTDPTGDAAHAGSERDDAHDGCESVHRLAGQATVVCQESEDGRTGLLQHYS
jgi:multidrug efflux pump subunit AcrA (membrane-fusion protein)